MLTYETTTETDRVTIAVRGDLDASEDTAPFVSEAGAICARAAVKSVVVDLASVGWLDFEGLGALLRIARCCEQHGTDFSICGAHDAVHAKLVQTGVLAYLEREVSSN